MSFKIYNHAKQINELSVGTLRTTNIVENTTETNPITLITVVGYLPSNPRPLPADNINFVTELGVTRPTSVDDPNLLQIPDGAIITDLKYKGIDGFSSAGNILISMAEFEGKIGANSYLVRDTTDTIANTTTGHISFTKVQSDDVGTSIPGIPTEVVQSPLNYIGISLTNPVTAGNLQIIVTYYVP